jgi:FtsZ-binding cell division protein ZapB
VSTSVTLKSSLDKLWSCAESLLVLSHGQASVETGFSINRQVEVDNLDESSFVAQRLICDHVNVIGGIMNFDSSNKKLLVSASSARQTYLASLEDARKIKECGDMDKKRKALSEEIDELKAKKQCLEKDVQSMMATADEIADQAEKTRHLTLIAKSNSLRRSAKEKTSELKTISQQLDEKLLQMKNSI